MVYYWMQREMETAKLKIALGLGMGLELEGLGYCWESVQALLQGSFEIISALSERAVDVRQLSLYCACPRP